MTKYEKKIRDINELSPREIEEMRSSLTKRAKVVKAPREILLEGKKAINEKPRGKVVKGANKEFLNRKW